MKCFQTHIDRFQFSHFLWGYISLFRNWNNLLLAKTKGSRWYLCYLFAFLHEKWLIFLKSVMGIDTDKILIINVEFVFFVCSVCFSAECKFGCD